MSQATIPIPDKLVPIFQGEARYRCAYGGRGSGKTRTFALMTAVRGYMWGTSGQHGQILCGREFQNSLSDSSLEEIKAAIHSVPWLVDYYEIGETFIRSRDGRINYTFAGLRRSLDSIKSKARVLLAWIDEAETVSETAWRKLVPTIREDGSEIWVTWNPESKLSATHKRFRETQPSNCKIVEINWQDNPWFPKELEQERMDDFQLRPETYGHIWEGEFLSHHEGAYYAAEMRDLKADGRITTVPYDKALPVVTAWDLGMGDTTAIWFAQFNGNEIRIIDHYETGGVGLDHYARVLAAKPYIYDQHILPHDVKVRELGTGKSRLEILQTLGVRPVQVAPQLNIDDGIMAVRAMLPKCWFDAAKCEHGLDALRQYHRDYDDVNMVWRGKPAHDWASHSSDAFRYLATGYRSRAGWGDPIRRNLKGVA